MGSVGELDRHRLTGGVERECCVRRLLQRAKASLAERPELASPPAGATS
jgi:hypothetical protein